ncbi:MAG TPA: carboxypeptidase-like regulatory domain-containing protein [Gemmatimonadales bacterium]|nr:carboxypeptidase-like regulatory domain-containing protein [Gemmatimonadales bacterium]
MQRARTSGRTGARVLAALAMLSVMACAEYRNASGPILPPPPPDNPQLTKASFVFYVNSRNGAIKIESPQGVVSPNPSIRASIVGPDYSLIAGDAITLTASNFTASTVGQFTPGKVRVRFDLSITNILSNVELRTPTFPAPPPGVSGVLMFPFATHVTVTSGGVSVGGSGDSVIVELPNTGQVAPSTDWDGDGSAGSGAPFNFFNDTGCPAGSNDCYRYEAFAAPIASGATTLSRTVGFDIDPTVSNFSAKIIVAADLHNSGPAPTGTVAGAVTSPQLGALSGVLVTVNTGGFTGTTASGTGAYSIANVTTGPKTVTLSGLPGGCTDPGPQSTTVNASATSTVNFSVTCPVPSGTVSGTITRTGPASPSLSGTIITATPAASGTSPSNTTLGGSLSYSISGVQIGSGAGAGSGAVAVSNLPAGCTTAPGSYSGLVLGGTATVNFTIDCQAPPAFYQYTALWGTPTGGQVTLTLSFDPSTLNDPAVNGGSPDDFNTFQATLSYSPTRLGFASCANGTGSSFTNITANGATAGSISLLNFKTGAGSTTSQVVAVCTFNVLTGSPASVTTSTSLEVISSFNGDNLIPKTQKNEGTLSLP